jgi:two-component system CheB/CheR fusion protein
VAIIDAKPEARQDDPEGPSPKAVVAVGASAGGLDALRRLLSGIGADLDAAIVVAQHLSPAHASALVDLLASGSPLPVVEATHGVRLARGVVYVTPPDHDVRYRDGWLELSAPPTAAGPKPSVDRLFASLAEAQGLRSIAVVLSGTGSDGTAGLLEVRRAGGLTLVQDPATCQYDGMPRSAITAGAANLVLPAEAMGAALASAIELDDRGDVEAPQADLAAVVQAVERATGIRLTQYKSGTVGRRIDRRMRLRQVATYDAYLHLLAEDPTEAQELARDVFIPVTEFFRDLSAFEALRRRLRERFADPPEGGLRIWVAGCSTGQEAYAIAMLCSDACSDVGTPGAFQVFATDISARAIDIARRGVYGAEVAEQVPAELIERHFVRDGDRFQVKPHVRDRILFSVHDLAKDPPFARLHVISCRNVLIYFEQALQDRTLAAFQYALVDDGLLFLGTSESVARYPTWFAADAEKAPVYRRIAGVARAHPNPYQPPPPLGTVKRSTTVTTEAERRERAMLAKLAEVRVDTALLLNERNEVLHTLGRAGDLARLRTGGASLDLLDLVDDDLRAPLRTLIYKARRGGGARFDALRAAGGDGGVPERVRLEVHPMGDGPEGALLVTVDRVPLEAAAQVGDVATRPSDDAVLRVLEAELAGTRASLQTLVEELENANEELQAANEEMQSANEEMLATNEELQTTNEEMQSASEELRTLNDELHTRNVELQRLSLDVQNIERGVDLPMLVLTSDLRVRRASANLAQVADIDGLLPGDPLAAVAWRSPVGTEIADAARLAIANGRTQRVVVTLGEATFEARVAAYATYEGERVGAVMTFFDVSERARSLQRVLAERQLAWSTLAALGEAVLTTDAHGVIEYANAAAAELTGRTTLDLVGRSLDEVVQLSADGGRTRLPNLAIDTLRTGDPMRSVTPLIATTGDVRHVVDYATHVLEDADGVPEGVVVVLRDVSERERLVAEVERRGNYDALTETLNRAAFERELERALEGVKAHGETHVLLYLDLDRFKIINDTSGHAAGDQVLRDMARNVKRVVRARDGFGRLGGDEFGVLVRNCTLAEGEAFAARLVRAMQDYALTWGGRRYTVALSVGAVLLERDRCDSIVEAMANADIALYEAKGRGGNGVYVFQSDDATRATRKDFSAVNDLTAALHDDRLVLYGQLITSAHDRRPMGVEVLARLRAPNDRIMQPAEFLPAAERFGIVRRLDRAVITKALAQLQVAAAADPHVRALDLHVNVSALTLSDLDFLGFVREQAGDADAPLGSLVFEVTESATITDLAAVASFVSGVRVLGAKLALDDFGRGASSFEHLRTLMPEIVKIDGQFVDGCTHDPVSKAIIRATVEIASLSGMRVVAEHVESDEDAATLVDLGVDAFQGYLVGRPAPLNEVLAAALRDV